MKSPKKLTNFLLSYEVFSIFLPPDRPHFISFRKSDLGFVLASLGAFSWSVICPKNLINCELD